MIVNKVHKNIYISDNENFGNYNKTAINDIIKIICENYKCFLQKESNEINCFIEYNDKYPMCCKIQEGHLIFSSTEKDYWAQWIYQFSHEYCHHIINGKFTSEINGLIWFEETICELSSMFYLHLIANEWENSIHERLRHFVPNLRSYLDDLLLQNYQYHTGLSPDVTFRVWLSDSLPLLQQPEYHRNYYRAIASQMFPLFVENPFLWKIILYFGDMREWGSLNSLFEYIEKHIDNTLSISFDKLKKLILI